jgi:hypothetical protein
VCQLCARGGGTALSQSPQALRWLPILRNIRANYRVSYGPKRVLVTSLRGKPIRTLPEGCARGQGPTIRRAARPVLPGSLNFKDKYAPNFPTVQIAYSTRGPMTSADQLEGMGLVAQPEKPPAPVFLLSNNDRIRRDKWPSYLRCVNDAPLNRDKSGPDISRADFTWCMTAISWGHGIEETAARLMEESTKPARTASDTPS